jgi:hypothetical protein
VSFVYMHAGTPLLQKGDFQMALPRMDLPVGIVEWEVFVPELYSVRAIDGNVIDRSTLPALFRAADRSAGVAGGIVGGRFGGIKVTAGTGLPGQIHGRATDEAGAVVPGVAIDIAIDNVHRAAVTDANGRYLVSDLPSGVATLSAQLAGFRTASSSFDFDRAAKRVDVVMAVASLSETVTVTAESPEIHAKARQMQKAPEPPSQNVVNLQRRAVGVLPVRIDVPRAGVSHQFVKPLVVDQETVVSLRYKRR